MSRMCQRRLWQSDRNAGAEMEVLVFTFRDNLSLTERDIQKIQSAPPGTKLYKNKIQGLGGRRQG